MDSVTDSELDSIFTRVERSVNLKKINTRQQLFNEIASSPKSKNWSTKLNDAIWNKRTDTVDNFINSIRSTAKQKKATQNVGFGGGKRVQIVYRKDGRTQLVGRDSKGRFTKLTKGDIWDAVN